MLKKYFTKKRIIISVVVLLAIFGIMSLYGGGNGEENLITVERGIVQEQVVVTGKVKADSQVNLGFDRGGRVARVYAKVGDRVGQGQVITELDYSETAADLAREQNILREEEIKLEAIRQSGPSALKEAQATLAAAVKEAYASADNAVRNKTDQFFKTPQTNPIFEIKITDGNFIHYFNVPTDRAIEINNMRRQVETVLSAWPTTADADKAIAGLNTISAFLDKVALAVNSFTAADYDYETTVTNFKTSLDAARSAVASARTKVITAQQGVSSAPVLGSSGVSSVAGQEAKVNQIKSSIQSIQASINKSRITAPFEGVVTTQDSKVGEAVSAGQAVVSLISDATYIEANVSEVNVGKVKVGDITEIQFDGLQGQTFSGKVAFVDPAETIIDQVVNYRLRIEFDPDARVETMVKSGLTSTVRIKTMSKEGVLAIPTYAITKENGKSYATVVSSSSEPVKREVVLGIIGSDGRAEVLSGLEEGDRIIFTK